MRTSKKLRKFVMALALAALAGGIAIGPARAEQDDWNRGRDRGHHEREWRGHERDREWREHARREEYWREQERREHGYVYAPPPVYYAPPPPPAALNFVFPLTIR